MAYELFFDGFEAYVSTADMSKMGYTSLPTGGISATGGRRSSKAIIGGGISGFTRSIAQSTHVVTGMALKTNTNWTLNLRNGSTNHASLFIPANVALSLTAGGVSVGASLSTFPPDTYMFVELGISVGSSGSYEVRVNGSSVGWFPAATGDTQNGATTTIDNVQLLSASGTQLFTLCDDLYITYGNELVWLGDSRADRLLLTGNTAIQDFIPSSGNAWERLNAGDGYIESDVDEATSFFELADLSYSPLTIHGVKVGGLIKKSDAGYREACLLTNSDGTITETSPLALSTDTLSIVTILKTDPATGLTWDLPGVQALQPGLRVKV